MNTSVICTFISPDRSGLVEELSKIIAKCDGNWLDSSMAHLAGQFAGIIRIEIAEENVGLLAKEFGKLEQAGMLIQLKPTLARKKLEQSATTDMSVDSNATELKLSIVGNDRPGIIQEVSYALAQARLNVVKMESWLSSAPMSGDPLFNASMLLVQSLDSDIEELKMVLDTISIALAIEIDLDDD